MKKLTPFVTVGIFLIGLALVWNALEARALPSSDAGAVQPTNTPAAPEGDIQPPLINQLPSSFAVAGAPERTQPEPPVAGQQVQDDAYIQWALQHAEALRQAGVRFRVINPGVRATGSASPQSPSAETCMDMLLNPQMDVLELGDGTGTIDHWLILFQNIYYDHRGEDYYHSQYHSLVMEDELDGSDTDLLYPGTDFDAFWQAFQAPDDLTYLKVSYHRLYANANDLDEAGSILWTLDDEGNLDEKIAGYVIGTSSPGWENSRSWELSSSELITASGKSLMLMFYLLSNQTAPGEVIWLDDAQVTLCFEPPDVYYVYLPVTLSNFANQPPPPACNPCEPDSPTQRGATTIGATCNGSFNDRDVRDYYSLSLSGVTNVQLRLFDLPSGTNWDALIYEDKGDGTYELICYTGHMTGDQPKHVDCTLDPSKEYLVVVNAGTEPGDVLTYQMSVEKR